MAQVVFNHVGSKPPFFDVPLSDGLACDTSLMVENETLKKEVNELTHALGNVYGGDARLLKYLVAKDFLSTKRD